MRLSDLPADVQAKVLGSIDAGSGKRQRPSRAGTGDSEPHPYRCVPCGDRFPSFTRWEAHSKKTGHGRGEAVL